MPLAFLSPRIVGVIADGAAPAGLTVSSLARSLTDGIGGYWPPPRMTEFHRLFPAISIEVLCSQAPPEVGSMEADIISTWHPPTHPDLVVLSKNRMIFNLARRPNILNEMGCCEV